MHRSYIIQKFSFIENINKELLLPFVKPDKNKLIIMYHILLCQNPDCNCLIIIPWSIKFDLEIQELNATIISGQTTCIQWGNVCNISSTNFIYSIEHKEYFGEEKKLAIKDYLRICLYSK